MCQRRQNLLQRIRNGDPICNGCEWNRLLIAKKRKAQGKPLDGIAKTMELSVKTLESCLQAWKTWWPNK